jgi:hypothetical protein
VLQPRALRQPQQTHILGESAETPETAATSVELLFSGPIYTQNKFQELQKL